MDNSVGCENRGKAIPEMLGSPGRRFAVVVYKHTIVSEIKYHKDSARHNDGGCVLGAVFFTLANYRSLFHH